MGAMTTITAFLLPLALAGSVSVPAVSSGAHQPSGVASAAQNSAWPKVEPAPSGVGHLVVVRRVAVHVPSPEFTTGLYGTIQLKSDNALKPQSMYAYSRAAYHQCILSNDETTPLEPNGVTGNDTQLVVNLWDQWGILSDEQQARGTIDTTNDSEGEHTVRLYGSGGRFATITYTVQMRWLAGAVTRIKLNDTDYSDPGNIYGSVHVCADGPENSMPCENSWTYELFYRPRSDYKTVWKGANIYENADSPVWVYSDADPGPAERYVRVLYSLKDSRFWRSDGCF